MKKLLVIFGKSGIGKTTLCDYIGENFRYDVVVSTTTRPMRGGEVDGVDYHFVDEKTFLEMFDNGEFVETAGHGKYLYGIQKKHIESLDYGVVVANIHGLQMIKDMYGDKVFSVLLLLQEKERLCRQILRGDNILKVAERYQQDEVLFAEQEKYADCCIETLGMSVEGIATELLDLIK